MVGELLSFSPTIFLQGGIMYTIKPIEFKEGVTLMGLPRLSADLPFGHSAVIRPFYDDIEKYIRPWSWFIQQRATRVAYGECNTQEEAIKECNAAWVDIVKQALKEQS
jgi:hypothetical protein